MEALSPYEFIEVLRIAVHNAIQISDAIAPIQFAGEKFTTLGSVGIDNLYCFIEQRLIANNGLGQELGVCVDVAGHHVGHEFQNRLLRYLEKYHSDQQVLRLVDKGLATLHFEDDRFYAVSTKDGSRLAL